MAGQAAVRPVEMRRLKHHPWVYQCMFCGAAVLDVWEHGRWHDRLMLAAGGE